MKKTISTNKLSIDLTDKTKSILEQLKEILMKPFGYIVNHTICTVCDAPKDVKEETLFFFQTQLKKLYTQMDNASPYELQALSEKAEAYNELAALMNGGRRIGIDEVIQEPSMVRYDIMDGYVICPDDWIVVNPEKAKNSSHAGVIECRRADVNMPHFLFFCNEKSRYFSDRFLYEINEACCKKWEKFREILSKQVKPIYDADRNHLNYKEWADAPTLGYFDLHEQGDPSLPPNFKFPLGAMIVHTNKSS